MLRRSFAVGAVEPRNPKYNAVTEEDVIYFKNTIGLGEQGVVTDADALKVNRNARIIYSNSHLLARGSLRDKLAVGVVYNWTVIQYRLDAQVARAVAPGAAADDDGAGVGDFEVLQQAQSARRSAGATWRARECYGSFFVVGSAPPICMFVHLRFAAS